MANESADILDKSISKAVDIVLKQSSVCDETKERIKLAFIDVFNGVENEEVASKKHRLLFKCFSAYCSVVRKIASRLEANGINVENTGEIKEELNGINDKTKSLEDDTDEEKNQVCEEPVNRTTQPKLSSDTNRIEQCISSACNRFSKPDIMETLVEAVRKVMKGECSLTAAANAHGLALSTLHSYVCRARERLGDDASAVPGRIELPKKRIIHGKSVNAVGSQQTSLRQKSITSQRRLKSLSTMVTKARKISLARRNNKVTKGKIGGPTTSGDVIYDKEKDPQHPAESSVAKASSSKVIDGKMSITASKDDLDDKFKHAAKALATQLVDEHFEKVVPNDYKGTRQELARKITKILDEYEYDGDYKIMCESMLKMFFESDLPENVTGGTTLPKQTVATFIRLVKGLLNAEKMIQKRRKTTGSRRVETGRKLLAEVDSQKSSDELGDSRLRKGLSGGIKRKKQPGTATKKSREGAKSKNKVANISGTALHTMCCMSNEEIFVKSLVSYLIMHQYRRSEEAQQNMQMCLEHIMLDGLSVTESLKVNSGPPEQILMIYLNRCRNVQKLLTEDFPAYKAEMVKVMNNVKNIASLDSLESLNKILPITVRNLLYTYIRKLSSANFPVDKSLVIGLLKLLLTDFVDEQLINDALLDHWYDDFRAEHPNIDI